jgi:hypothetical protein
VEGSCEHGDEPSGSLKCWEVPEWLHNWQLLRKGSAPLVSKKVSPAIFSNTIIRIPSFSSLKTYKIHPALSALAFAYQNYPLVHGLDKGVNVWREKQTFNFPTVAAQQIG